MREAGSEVEALFLAERCQRRVKSFDMGGIHVVGSLQMISGIIEQQKAPAVYTRAWRTRCTIWYMSRLRLVYD